MGRLPDIVRPGHCIRNHRDPRKGIEDGSPNGGRRKAGIFLSRQTTQNARGSDLVKALTNLALLCGSVRDFPGAGLNALRTESNSQGACDLGCLPQVFPGYQPVGDIEARKRNGNRPGECAGFPAKQGRPPSRCCRGVFKKGNPGPLSLKREPS